MPDANDKRPPTPEHRALDALLDAVYPAFRDVLPEPVEGLMLLVDTASGRTTVRSTMPRGPTMDMLAHAFVTLRDGLDYEAQEGP